MKHPRMPRWLTYTLLAGLGVIFVAMPFHAFLSTWGGTAIGPLWLWKSWKELLLVLLAVLSIAWLITQPQVIRELSRKPLVIVLVLYLVLTGGLAALHWGQNGVDASLAGLAMNLRYIAVAALAYLVFSYGKLPTVWFGRARWFVVGAGVTVAAIGIVQVALLPTDFLTQFGYDKDASISPVLLIDDNPDNVRAFATLRGPNDFGAFLILPFLLLLTKTSWRRPITVVAASVLLGALLLSGSRSAWLGMGVALAVYGLFYFRRRLSLKRVGIAAGATLVLAAGLLVASVTVPALRMAVFHSSPGDPTLTEGSTDDHLAATVAGAQRVVASPLGCGPGCAGPASYYGQSPQISENYFIQIAEETGVIGLALFGAIVVLMANMLYRANLFDSLRWGLLASLAGYLIIGLLLHVWSDDPLSITWWMLAGAVLGYNERQQWIKSKNSSRSRTS